MVRSMAALVALSAVVGCGNTYGPCDGRNAWADGAVDLSGDQPVFDWEFGTAYALSVYELDGDDLGRVMWHVQCGGDNLENDERLEEQVCIETPIAYGAKVDSPFLDAVNLTRPKDLVPGARYQVRLNTLTEEDAVVPEAEHPAWMDFLDWQTDRDDPHCGSGYSAEVDFVAPEPGLPAEG